MVHSAVFKCVYSLVHAVMVCWCFRTLSEGVNAEMVGLDGCSSVYEEKCGTMDCEHEAARTGNICCTILQVEREFRPSAYLEKGRNTTPKRQECTVSHFKAKQVRREDYMWRCFL